MPTPMPTLRRLSRTTAIAASLLLTACGTDADTSATEWAEDASAIVTPVSTSVSAAAARAACLGDKAARGCDPSAVVRSPSEPPLPSVIVDSSPDPIPAVNPAAATETDRSRPPLGDTDRPDAGRKDGCRDGRKGCGPKPGRNTN